MVIPLVHAQCLTAKSIAIQQYYVYCLSLPNGDSKHDIAEFPAFYTMAYDFIEVPYTYHNNMIKTASRILSRILSIHSLAKVILST